jgi:DNA-binding XRE family transcriptional regulator
MSKNNNYDPRYDPNVSWDRIKNIKLVRLIKASGYREKELATRIGISYRNLLRYIMLMAYPYSGKGTLRQTARKISKYFNLPPEDIWIRKHSINFARFNEFKTKVKNDNNN